MIPKIFLLPVLIAGSATLSSGQVLTDFVRVDGTFSLDDCGFDSNQYAIQRLRVADAISDDTPSLNARVGAGPLLPSLSLNLPYSLDVGVNGDARTWSVKVGATLANGDILYSRPRTTSPVTSSSADVTGFDLSIETALVTVRYLDDANNLVSMSDSDLTFYNAGAAQAGGIPVRRGVTFSRDRTGTEHQLLVRANEDLRLRVEAFTGTDPYTDTNSYLFEFDQLTTTGELTTDAGAGAIRFAACSTSTITVRIPTGTLGQIRGTVDMVGVNELLVPGDTFASSGVVNGERIDISSLQVERPGSSRFARRSTPPHSGEYLAENLLPTTALGGQTYKIQAHLLFENSGIRQRLRTPSLTGVELAPGQNLNLDLLDDPSDTQEDPFVLANGAVRGRLSLCGPPVRKGEVAMLSNINGVSGDENSYPESTDRTAFLLIGSKGPVGGRSNSYLAGAFSAGTGVYEGDYEFRVGGLYRESSDWQTDRFSMILTHPSPTVTDDYFRQDLLVLPRVPRNLRINDGATISNEDYRYDFGEVLVRFRAVEDDEQFYGPVVLASGGRGEPRDPAGYFLGFTRGFGLPRTVADSALNGSVRMLLPEGSYTLRPSVRAESTRTTVAFPPLAVQVSGKSYQVIDPPLQPPVLDSICFDKDTPLTGRIVSRDEDGNAVKVNSALLIYDGRNYELPLDGSIDPTFIIDFTALGITPEEGEQFITIIAKGTDGRESRIDIQVINDTTPPELIHPEEVVVDADPTLDCAAVVEYDVSATDNCPGKIDITCDPPSGSQFPVGSTTVNCSATDHAGNTRKSKFIITVRPYFRLRPGIILEWNPTCSVLQCSTDMENWTDVSGAKSPYCQATDELPRKFFRFRPLNETDRPDLIVTQVHRSGPATIDRDDRPVIPLEVTIANTGTRPAGIFKLAVTYPSGIGNILSLASYRVPGQSFISYPFTVGPLNPGCEITFAGSLLFPETRQGNTVEITVEADSCFADEFQPEWCRVEESNEDNNLSTPLKLDLPRP